MKGSLQAFQRGLSRVVSATSSERASKLQTGTKQQKAHQNWSSQQSSSFKGVAAAAGAFVASLGTTSQRSMQIIEQKQFSSNRSGLFVAYVWHSAK
jgi:hypothetical protein